MLSAVRSVFRVRNLLLTPVQETKPKMARANKIGITMSIHHIWITTFRVTPITYPRCHKITAASVEKQASGLLASTRCRSAQLPQERVARLDRRHFDPRAQDEYSARMGDDRAEIHIGDLRLIAGEL
jgi:hypothetical protein